MIEINLTNTIFLFCVLVAGGLLLLMVVVDDVLGGFLDALRALWQAALGALETHFGDATIRAPRDRARGRSSGGGATPTH